MLHLIPGLTTQQPANTVFAYKTGLSDIIAVVAELTDEQRTQPAWLDGMVMGYLEIEAVVGSRVNLRTGAISVPDPDPDTTDTDEEDEDEIDPPPPLILTLTAGRPSTQPNGTVYAVMWYSAATGLTSTYIARVQELEQIRIDNDDELNGEQEGFLAVTAPVGASVNLRTGVITQPPTRVSSQTATALADGVEIPTTQTLYMAEAVPSIDGAEMAYRLFTGNDIFEMDLSTGALTPVAAFTPDHATQDEYVLLIRVYQGGNFGSEFLDFNVTIPVTAPSP